MDINNSARPDFKSVAILLGAVLLIGIAIFSVSKLIELQRESYRHKVDALLANDGAGLGTELQWFAFRAAGERKFEGTWQVAWYESKLKSRKIVGQLLEAADDGEEKQLLGEADKALQTFIDLFEKRLLPQLEKDASQNEINATGTLLAEQAAILSVRMNKYMLSLQQSARDIDAAYESEFHLIIWLMVGVVLLALGLSIRFIQETRSYARTVCETERLLSPSCQGGNIQGDGHWQSRRNNQ